MQLPSTWTFSLFFIIIFVVVKLHFHLRLLLCKKRTFSNWDDITKGKYSSPNVFTVNRRSHGDIFIPIWDIRCCVSKDVFRFSSRFYFNLSLSFVCISFFIPFGCVLSSHTTQIIKDEKIYQYNFSPRLFLFIPGTYLLMNGEEKYPIFAGASKKFFPFKLFFPSLIFRGRGWHITSLQWNEIYDYGLKWKDSSSHWLWNRDCKSDDRGGSQSFNSFKFNLQFQLKVAIFNSYL